MTKASQPIRYIDSHTEGEPTRVILEGGPDLGTGSLVTLRERFAEQFDAFRSAVVLEPRGSDAVVGALLCEPVDPSCFTGVIFFNNRGYLGMCGHGMMGLAATLAHVGKISVGRNRIETPVGIVEVDLLNANEAVIQNVPSYCYRESVKVEVPGLGTLAGDIAWGGNWFFLVEQSSYMLERQSAIELTLAAGKVKESLIAQGITGQEGAEIDHVEFFGPPTSDVAHSRNFVYCPGGAYDRSPCGTGTSAKLACLAAAGLLKPGELFIQESFIGSLFQASYQVGEGRSIIPSIRGRAYITAEGVLIRQQEDPYRNGIILK